MTTEYRILEKWERVIEGDEYQVRRGGTWFLSHNWYSPPGMQETAPGYQYRRHVPKLSACVPQWKHPDAPGCPVHVLWAESPPIVRTVAQVAAEAKPEAVEPGTGYRLLGDDEIVRSGDEWHNPGSRYGDWPKAMGSVGHKVLDMGFIYRRKLEIPGEGYAVVPLGELIQTGDEWLQGDGSWRVTGLPGGVYEHKHGINTLRRKLPVAQPQYRPYANAAEAAEGLQGKLIRHTATGKYYPVTCVTGAQVIVAEDGISFSGLLNYWKFTDGTPCGVLITNQGTK